MKIRIVLFNNCILCFFTFLFVFMVDNKLILVDIYHAMDHILHQCRYFDRGQIESNRYWPLVMHYFYKVGNNMAYVNVCEINFTSTLNPPSNILITF